MADYRERQPGPTNPPRPVAKPCPSAYRRNLPHIQAGEKPIFITFCTHARWVLPESVRALVLRHSLHDHGRKYWLHVAVVMPDHVHMILSPYRDVAGCAFGLPEILHGIKSASAHAVNKALGRKGRVWQEESFDHILRSSESLAGKAEYICNNPVRKGLVRSAGEWPWLWTDQMART
jgi:REP element-mobilizing transposase RayT